MPAKMSVRIAAGPCRAARDGNRLQGRDHVVGARDGDAFREEWPRLREFELEPTAPRRFVAAGVRLARCDDREDRVRGRFEPPLMLAPLEFVGVETENSDAADQTRERCRATSRPLPTTIER